MNRKSYFVVGTSLLSAISLILEIYVHFPVLPAAPFLLYSPGDLPIIVASLILGPISGVFAAFVNATLFAVITGQGGPWGAFMHFIASGGMTAVIGLIAKKKGNLLTAFASGILTRVALMVPLNLVVTPIFMGVPRSVVVQMILPVIVPFNLIHAGVNSLLAYPVIKALSKRVTTNFKTSGIRMFGL